MNLADGEFPCTFQLSTRAPRVGPPVASPSTRCALPSLTRLASKPREISIRRKPMFSSIRPTRLLMFSLLSTCLLLVQLVGCNTSNTKQDQYVGAGSVGDNNGGDNNSDGDGVSSGYAPVTDTTIITKSYTDSNGSTRTTNGYLLPGQTPPANCDCENSSVDIDCGEDSACAGGPINREGQTCVPRPQLCGNNTSGSVSIGLIDCDCPAPPPPPTGSPDPTSPPPPVDDDCPEGETQICNADGSVCGCTATRYQPPRPQPQNRCGGVPNMMGAHITGFCHPQNTCIMPERFGALGNGLSGLLPADGNDPGPGDQSLLDECSPSDLASANIWCSPRGCTVVRHNTREVHGPNGCSVAIDFSGSSNCVLRL